jgi:hypothetical protein
VPAGDPSSIVVADMQNESDALHILALASQHGERKGADDERGLGGEAKPNMPDRHDKGKGKEAEAEADLADFSLIKLGIATKEQVVKLTDIFFKCHHHLLVRQSIRRDCETDDVAYGSILLDPKNTRATCSLCPEREVPFDHHGHYR